MRLTPGERVDVRLAPFPWNAAGRLVVRFRASFCCRPLQDGIEVTRMLSFRFTPLVCPLLEPVLRRSLPGSVRRELDLTKQLLGAPQARGRCRPGPARRG